MKWLSEWQARVFTNAPNMPQGSSDRESDVEPRIAVVLGSGLGGFADDFDEAVGIPYEEIPGFMRSTAQGHAGRLVVGKVDSVPVLAMQGRVHYYEGYSLEEVTFPIRTFKLLGIKTLILTNAAGGINVQLTQGALMVHQRSPEPDGRQSVAWAKRRTLWTTLSGYVGGLLA